MDVWLPLLSGFIGAVIGAAASIITVIVQARHETKRHRSRILSELALKEGDAAWERATQLGVQASIPPAVVYMHYYDLVLKLLEEGRLDEKTYDEVVKANRRFIEITEQHDEPSSKKTT